ncbi:uridine kinase family protein [Paenibacillus phyllosphaerae]|nr:uridine kinase [Paenibacillus phyllosphaerae]
MHAKPIIVGIAGGSGSGKTTWCDRLAQSIPDLPIKIIHEDHYYFRTRMTSSAPYTDKVYEDFNHPDSIDFPKMMEDLLRAANDAETEVVLVEGILVLAHPPLREWLDLKLYVECQADERIVRRIDRFMKKGFDYQDIVTEYVDIVRHRHDEFVEPSKWHADLILNGSGDPDKSVRVVQEWIKQALRSRKSFETVRDFNGKR